jgi:hypothetical protein
MAGPVRTVLCVSQDIRFLIPEYLSEQGQFVWIITASVWEIISSVSVFHGKCYYFKKGVKTYIHSYVPSVKCKHKYA